MRYLLSMPHWNNAHQIIFVRVKVRDQTCLIRDDIDVKIHIRVLRRSVPFRELGLMFCYDLSVNKKQLSVFPTYRHVFDLYEGLHTRTRSTRVVVAVGGAMTIELVLHVVKHEDSAHLFAGCLNSLVRTSWGVVDNPVTLLVQVAYAHSRILSKTT